MLTRIIILIRRTITFEFRTYVCIETISTEPMDSTKWKINLKLAISKLLMMLQFFFCFPSATFVNSLKHLFGCTKKNAKRLNKCEWPLYNIADTVKCYKCSRNRNRNFYIRWNHTQLIITCIMTIVFRLWSNSQFRSGLRFHHKLMTWMQSHESELRLKITNSIRFVAFDVFPLSFSRWLSYDGPPSFKNNILLEYVTFSMKI